MILLHGHFVFSPLYWAYRYDAYLVGFGIFAAAMALAPLPTPTALPRGALPALLVASLVPVVSDVREGFVPDAEIEGCQRIAKRSLPDEPDDGRGNILVLGVGPGAAKIGVGVA